MTTGRRRAVAVIDGLVGLNAIGGMVYALGGAKAVPKDWLEDSPFDDYRIPGLYLGTVVGGTCRAAAIAAAAPTVGWLALHD